MALDFFAGCAGGAAGVIVGHPLDTVKVRLQTQDPSNIKYRGTFHCLSTIVKQESVSGLYKGISSPLFGVAGVNAIIFGVYGALRPYVSSSPGNDALWAHFAAGSISGAVQSVVASPMELVKTRMQINQDSNVGGKKAGPVDVLRRIYQNEGGLFRGVFKGWNITLAREIPGFGFYFASYEALTRFGDGEVSTLGMMLAGGMAGVISWIVTFPIDVVKTRLQCDDRRKYTGIIDCIRKTYSNEGHRAFSRGLVSTVIRAFPTNAATFTVVTWIMRFAGETQGDDVQNTKQYLDELLRETSKLQGRFEDSLRVKVPQYFMGGNSLTSCSLASQCAASAQKYADRTQVYFNFYQSLQQHAQQHVMPKNEQEEEEEKEDAESGGVEKEHHVSLLHERIAMHMHDDEIRKSSRITNNSSSSGSTGTQELSSQKQREQSSKESIASTLASRRSSWMGASADEVIIYKNDNEHHDHGRIEDDAVLHNNSSHNIPSTSKSFPSATRNTSFFVERETITKPDSTISCDETESPTTTTISTAATMTLINSNLRNGTTSTDVGREHGKSCSTSSSMTGSLIQGNKRLSHEASSLPVQSIKPGSITFADNDNHQATTGAREPQRNAVERINNCGTHHNDDDADKNQALSSRELSYLSKSLDIPVHILKAATLQQQQSIRNTFGKVNQDNLNCQSKNEDKVRESTSSSPTRATPTLTRRSGASANASCSKRTQVWKNYCKTSALHFCKCFEDHCVCYF